MTAPVLRSNLALCQGQVTLAPCTSPSEEARLDACILLPLEHFALASLDETDPAWRVVLLKMAAPTHHSGLRREAGHWWELPVSCWHGDTSCRASSLRGLGGRTFSNVSAD